MSSHTLEDVRMAIALGKKDYFGPLHVYITDFEADIDFPCKFMYKGCTEDNGFGFQCCKSMERGPCRDHPFGEAWAYKYRFDVYLVDSTISAASPPLRVTIFDAPLSLLDRSPVQLNAQHEISQYELVHAATQKLKMVYVYLAVSPGKETFPIVEKLWIDKSALPIPSPRSPALSLRSPRPRSVGVPSQVASSSSEKNTAGSQTNASKEETVRTALFTLMEALGHTKLIDH